MTPSIETIVVLVNSMVVFVLVGRHVVRSGALIQSVVVRFVLQTVELTLRKQIGRGLSWFSYRPHVLP